MNETTTPVAPPVVNKIGALTGLGPVRHALLDDYLRWQNDAEVNRTRIFTPRPLTEEAVRAWYARVSQQEGLDNPTFTIYERANWRPIGLTSLFNIDFWSSTAEYGIVIGEKTCWGKGYGTEVTRLMLEFAFRGLCLQQLHLRTMSFNERGIRAYLRAGFRHAGRLRHAHRVNGQPCDVVLMDCVASEFLSGAPLERDAETQPEAKETTSSTAADQLPETVD